jgi:hypothetical protein
VESDGLDGLDVFVRVAKASSFTAVAPPKIAG